MSDVRCPLLRGNFINTLTIFTAVKNYLQNSQDALIFLLVS